MKKLLSTVLLFTAIMCFAEYQVFQYIATFKHVEPDLTTGGTIVVNDSLRGYLITVCCYPCGASMGKGYPNWLYVIRGRDKTRTLWKIPVKVDGGIFGRKIDAKKTDETWGDYLDANGWDYGLLKPLLKPANKSWAKIYFETTMFKKLIYKNRKVCARYDYGLLGYKNNYVSLYHSGFGSANIKLNKTLVNYVNPYIVSISGTIVGEAALPAFSLDPSNFTTYDISPISGVFRIRFNNKLTEEMRGTSDWEELDQRMYRHLKFNDLLEDKENWSLW